MIVRLHERSHHPRHSLAEALGRPLSPDEESTEQTIVAHWPGLDHYTLEREQQSWRPTQWAEHLEGPYLEHPFTASPKGDRHAIWHLDARLHPDDSELTGSEWAEAAHRFTRSASVEVLGAEYGCRWVAVQAQPRRIDLIANLIRADGTWHTAPIDTPRRLAAEARGIEQDLRLVPVHNATPAQPRTAAPPPARHTAHRSR